MKKLLSVLVAIIIIASTQVPFANAEATSVSKIESLLKTAEKHAGELKWQISYEYTKEIKNPDMKVLT